MRPAFAHIGYHRTGTNFLQREIFPKLPLFRPESSAWRQVIEGRAAGYYQQQDATCNPDSLPMLISSESLSGTLEEDRPQIARLLADLNREVRILVVVRRQPDIFRSLYAIHVKQGHRTAFRAFALRLAANRRCDYAAMLARLHKELGREQVMALPYEMLRDSPQGFVAELCRFLGAPPPAFDPARVNASWPDAEIRLRRLLNRAQLKPGRLALVARALNPILPPLLDSETSAIVERAYRESNRKMADLVDWDPESYGY